MKFTESFPAITCMILNQLVTCVVGLVIYLIGARWCVEFIHTLGGEYGGLSV